MIRSQFHFKGLVARCHSFWNFIIIFFNVHSYITITLHSYFTIRRSLSSWILIASSLSKGSLHGMPNRESNSGLPYSKPTHYQLSCAAPYWAAPHPTDLRRILLSCAASYWAAPHPLSCAASYWAAPHPTELHRILQSCAASNFILQGRFDTSYESESNRVSLHIVSLIPNFREVKVRKSFDTGHFMNGYIIITSISKFTDSDFYL